MAGTQDSKLRELVRLPLPTRFGLFQASAFECATGFVYVALTQGNVAGRDVLARLHSQCLTGDALGSLPLATAPHNRNLGYLRTKEQRLGHIAPLGQVLSEQVLPPVDASQLLGPVRPRAERPYVVLKFAQTLDGRIATGTGEAKRISGEDERRVSHALRAGCDAVMVGIGTVLRDDPQLTVRMVPGASPRRVVLDSSLRTPLEAKILNSEAPTTIITTPRASQQRRELLRRDRHVQIHLAEPGPHGVDIQGALKALRESGAASLLVEGGPRVITSLLAAGVVDRLIVGIAPVIIGSGTEAVGELGVQRLTDGIRLKNRTMHGVADDVLLSGDIA